MSVELRLSGEQSTFAPGETITGVARWEAVRPPAWLAVRLFWYTTGKGTQDVGVVSEQRSEQPAAIGEQVFRFTAPAHPPSCSGRLVSVRWALELVGDHDQVVPRIDLVIAPGGREVLLGQVD
jgi:hypothetical protein